LYYGGCTLKFAAIEESLLGGVLAPALQQLSIYATTYNIGTVKASDI
jgi:hypothetical protein